jgi:hypothetical protein
MVAVQQWHWGVLQKPRGLAARQGCHLGFNGTTNLHDCRFVMQCKIVVTVGYTNITKNLNLHRGPEAV